jgi:hypothetical protein
MGTVVVTEDQSLATIMMGNETTTCDVNPMCHKSSSNDPQEQRDRFAETFPHDTIEKLDG